VLTEKTLDDTGATKEHSPRKSRVKLAQQADTFVSLVRTTTKLLKLRPYKITQMQSLQPTDIATRLHLRN
jgi:hypothetical protein